MQQSLTWHIFFIENELQTLAAPTNALFYILRVLPLICSYMFRRNRHLQGAYTSVVKTYNNKIVLR